MSEEKSLDAVRSTVRSWYWASEAMEAAASHIRRHVLDSAENETCGERIWKTRHKEVYVHELPESAGGFRVAVKDYHEKRFWRYLFRPSLAYREAKGFETVRRLGIPAVPVVLCGEDRSGVRLKRAYFVTRFEEGTHAMLDFAPSGPFAERHDDMMTLLKLNIEYVARLHAAGFSHGGAHARNFLWKRQADGSLALIWIDLATVKAYHGKARERIALDLCDVIEAFRLSDAELAELNALYRSIHDIPVVFKRQDVSERKFNVALYIL